MCPDPTEPETPALPRGDEIVQLQEQLDRLGFDPGKIDGLFGPRSRAALIRYERAQSVATPAGEPTPELRNAVASASASAQGDVYRRAAEAAQIAGKQKRELADQLRAQANAPAHPMTHPHEEASAAALAAANHYARAAELWPRAREASEAWKLNARAAEARRQARQCAELAHRGFVEVAREYAESGQPLTQARALEGAAKAAELAASC